MVPLWRSQSVANRGQDDKARNVAAGSNEPFKICTKAIIAGADGASNTGGK